MAVIDAAATPGVLANTSMQSPSMKLQSITDQTWVVSAEMEHHDDIQQGGGAIEQMDMVEHQSLHQHEHHEDAESF